MPYQIIYSSVSTMPMQQEQLQALLEQAQRRNDARGITGAMVYADGYFLQVLEGEMDSVGQLMDRIAGDLRHEAVTVLQSGPIDARVFSDWDMAYVSATPEQVAQWVGLRHTTLPDLFEDMRHNRETASRVTRSILAVLLGKPQAQPHASPQGPVPQVPAP